MNILLILSADHASLDDLVRIVSGLSSGDGSACLLDWEYFLSKHCPQCQGGCKPASHSPASFAMKPSCLGIYMCDLYQLTQAMGK